MKGVRIFNWAWPRVPLNVDLALARDWLSLCLYICLFGYLFGCLSGCTPRFDWREIRHPDYGYYIQFPAKPVQVSRTLALAGQDRKMVLQAAKIDDMYFAVGVVPEVSAAEAPRLIATLRDSALKNIQATVSADANMSTNISASTSTRAPSYFKAHGRILTNGGPQAAYLLARFGYVRGQVYQVLAVGPSTQLPLEVAEQFVEQFKE
jgi:hypothetical protein